MTPEQEALREKVARAMAAGDSGPEGSTLFEIHMREFGDGYRKGADAVIAVVLDEAAKVAETCRKGGPLKPVAGEILVGWTQGNARDAAAAIRAMIP